MLVAAGATALGASAGMVWLLSRPKQSKDAPASSTLQRRLIVKETSKDLTKVKLEVEQVPIPVPKPGQVLVKVLAVPIHPSVFNEWKSERFQGKPFGNEGSGIVVASGGGLVAGALVGKKVGLIATGKAEATAAEYVCVDALRSVWSFPNSVETVDAAAWFVNPVTALSILDIATKQHKSPALLHTGASSQLGQMLVKLALEKRVTLLNLVRRQEHVDMLQKLGARHVVCQADDDWLDQLQSKIKELNVQVAFDAVSGDMTGQVLARMPPKGIVYVYGVLSGDPTGGIDPIDLIYRQKQVKGHNVFFTWVAKAPGGPLGPLFRMQSCVKQVASGLGPGEWASSQFEDCTMEELQDQFTATCQKGFTGRKLRVRMDL